MSIRRRSAPSPPSRMRSCRENICREGAAPHPDWRPPGAHLKASLDDKIVLMVQAADGSMGAQLFRVDGIFRSGAPEMDEGVVFILRSDAAEPFRAGRPHHAKPRSCSIPRGRFRLALATLEEGPRRRSTVEILPWWQVEPFLQQFIQIDDAFFYIIVLILFIVISIGILNTIMMSIFERVREFGVMMALGTKPRQIVQTRGGRSVCAGPRRGRRRQPARLGCSLFTLPGRHQPLGVQCGRGGAGHHFQPGLLRADRGQPDFFQSGGSRGGSSSVALSRIACGRACSRWRQSAMSDKSRRLSKSVMFPRPITIMWTCMLCAT